MQTTVGQVLINAILPTHLRNYTRVLDKKGIQALLSDVADEKDNDLYRDVVKAVHDLGITVAQSKGSSFSIRDLQAPPKTRAMRDALKMKVTQIVERDDLTTDQKNNAIQNVVMKAAPVIDATLKDELIATGNPFGLQIISGSRGGAADVRSLMVGDLMVTDHKDRLIPTPVLTGYGAGVSPAEYWAGSYGARKGGISAKLCVSMGCEIRMADWSVKRIEDIRAGDYVMRPDSRRKLVPVRVSNVYNNGLRECFDHRFKVNQSSEVVGICATADHKVLATRQFSGGTKGGSYRTETRMWPLAYAARKDGSRNKTFSLCLAEGSACSGVDEPRALLLGLMLGDGCMAPSARSQYRFSCADPTLLSDVAPYLRRLNIELIHYNCYEYGLSDYRKCRKVFGHRGHYNSTKRWLKIQAGECLAHAKTIPADVWSWDNNSIAWLIGGLISCDGSVVRRKGGITIAYNSTSYAMISALKELLAVRFGIYTGNIYATDAGDFNGGKRKHTLYTLSIAHYRAISLFVQQIPLVGAKAAKIGAFYDLTPVAANSRYAAVLSQRIPMGLLPTYDLEVDHPSHCYALANGIIVSNSTAKTGFLGKQLVQAAHKNVVTTDDCETGRGIPVEVGDPDNIGTVLADAVGDIPAGTIIDTKIAQRLQKTLGKDGELTVRSPMTCQAHTGVCAKCTGVRERGSLPDIGDAVGVASAHAITERVSQTALSLKHGGGRATGKETDAPSGYNLINQLVQVPSSFKGGAAVAPVDGTVKSVEKAPQGGFNVIVGDKTEHVPAGFTVSVKPGDRVEAGDLISDGIPNPADLVQHRGIGAGRLEFMKIFRNAFKDSGMSVNRRNIEMLSRGLVGHVRVTDLDGVPDALPDDVVDYNTIERNYRPRYGFRVSKPTASVGTYLEAPARQYTIGTRITKRVADDLKKHKVDNVTVHADKPSFQPEMIRAMTQLMHSPDWQQRLGGSYLQRGFLEAVHRGRGSAVSSESYIPGLARTADFGKGLTEKGTY